MAGEKALTASEQGNFLSEMLSARLFKPTQGRLTRQITCLAIWLTIAVGVYRTAQVFPLNATGYAIWTPIVLALAWMAYRLVNWPPFADFLIAVEAEMNKMTWPSWEELKIASLVVIFTMFALAAVVYLLDVFWTASIYGLDWLAKSLLG